jgi:hypothetical protein
MHQSNLTGRATKRQSGNAYPHPDGFAKGNWNRPVRGVKYNFVHAARTVHLVFDRVRNTLTVCAYITAGARDKLIMRPRLLGVMACLAGMSVSDL